MKRGHFIALLWAIWICSIISMVFGVYYYIDNKRVRLRTEIRENIEKIFEGQSSGEVFVNNDDGFFDESFSVC